jgi:hypothetical protein
VVEGPVEEPIDSQAADLVVVVGPVEEPIEYLEVVD